MKNAKILTVLFLTLALFLFWPQAGQANPLGTAFTYQGRLIDSNYTAYGLYDFQFRLYDADVAGNPIGSGINKPNVNVTDGYFTEELDFGNVFDGNERWLEISVRPSGDLNDPCVLSPRQKVMPTPYALQTRGIFVDNTGNVGIGTTTPDEKLHIVGNIKIVDGNQGEGKVLTSNADGVGTWQAVAGGLPKIYSAVGVSNIETMGYLFADMPDMTITQDFSAGKIFVTFQATVTVMEVGGLEYILMIDNVPKNTGTVSILFGGSNPATLQWVETVTAGTHTIKVQWRAHAQEDSVYSTGQAWQWGTLYKRTLIVITGI